MTSHLWILLLASIVATRAQELDLSDALFDDDSKPTAKPPVKPTPPKNSNPNGFDLSDAFDLEPKKPDVNPPKSKDDPKKPTEEGFDLSDALGPDLEPKKPLVPPREGGGTGGGSLDDNDLFDLTEDGSEYKPDGGRSGGRGADPQNDGASDHPQDLNQQWLQLIKMLGDNIPEGLSVWIAQFKQVVEPLLERVLELLNIAEQKTEL
ncbi:CD99 antigen-like protein 2 isoform X2 [Myxocyprinus asiaticus]|uniref:CD99 antigen-like protein 2 isoform X2 n=1 Tax=Myxocyprinus asiaticus TaxID=70543 RepID=UPI00222313F3|nr:CD99 antigen-like protein 2 isoform X2 [Myxocyprinus asiaticus]